MGDIQGAMPVSKDREVNSQTNPFFIKISDGVTAAAVDAASQALMVKMVDAAGTIVGDVRITDGADLLSVLKDGDAVAAGTGGVAVLGTDGANYQVLAVEVDGRVKVSDGDGVLSVDDAGGSLTVDGTVTADQGAAVALAGAWPIKITDGTEVALVTEAGHLQIDLAAQSLTAVKVSKDENPNSDANPLFVTVVSGAAGGEVHDYNTAANVAASASSNHDYTVTAAKTLLLKALICGASGAAKWELKVGELAALQTKAVAFTTVAEPMWEPLFDPPIEIPDTNTGTARIIRTNREVLAMDVYSTIIGREVGP